MSQANRQTTRRVSKLLLAGIFLASFSLLALEISLTRVLSVMFAYHYVFVVISLALLGLGLGAVFVYRYRDRLANGQSQFRYLAIFAGLLSLSIPPSLIITARLADTSDGGSILLYVPLLFAPFFFGGTLLAAVFRQFPESSSRLYSADLLGAASGAVGVVLILNAVDSPRTIAIIGMVALMAAGLFGIKATGLSPRRLMTSATGPLITLSVLGTVLAGTGLADVGVGKSPDKEINNSLYEPSLGARIIETKWSAFGRTDLVAYRNDPSEMVLFLDGTAGTPMYKFGGDIRTAGPAIQRLKTEFPAYLSLSNLKPTDKNTALIIGPGGGRDVLVALLAGMSKITAVEVNQDLVDMVREYSNYNGGIYDREDVNVIVDEGRNFLKRQQVKYDVIMLSLPVTKTSRSVEGYALTENFLFTAESISDYMAHLSDDGQLVVVAHAPDEIVKLLSVSLAALKQEGIDTEAAMKRIYVIGSHHFPVFAMKKTPFEPAELVSIHQSIHQLGYEPTSSYIPTVRPGSCNPHESGARFDECGMLNPVLIGLNRGDISIVNLTSILKDEGLDIKPATDDSPFFYRSEEGIPMAVSFIFWSSALTLLPLLMVPLMRRRKTVRERGALWACSADRKLFKFLVFFSILGIGFMLVEISIFQRSILFIGQPILSLAVLLSSLLVGGGIGSLYSDRFGGKPAKVIFVISLGIVVILLGYAFAMPAVFGQFLGAGLFIRLLVMIVMITPLGFLMGFPFPMGLRLLKETSMESYIPWMWGVNSVGSVVGSAATIAVAMTLGFTSALVLGAACYLMISLLCQTTRAEEESQTEEMVSQPMAEVRRS